MTLTPAQRDRLTRAITGHRVDLGYCTTRLGQADARAIVDKLAAALEQHETPNTTRDLIAELRKWNEGRA